jgi:hypothetical protein
VRTKCLRARLIRHLCPSSNATQIFTRARFTAHFRSDYVAALYPFVCMFGGRAPYVNVHAASLSFSHFPHISPPVSLSLPSPSLPSSLCFVSTFLW